IYDFFKLAGSAIKVTRLLQDGDVIDLGGVTLQVLHTPGHSPGSISLYCPEDEALITADAVQPVGGLPLYADLAATRASMRRLLDLPRVTTLYCAHAEQPYVGDAVRLAIQAGLDYVDRVDAAAREAARSLPADAVPEEITREALVRLGLTPPPVMPITITSIMSHLGVA
ncbi:MAG: MBL fold metallo-hydrolase, partial [Chloroflexi bacterium]|nr:MBL fold metallo-hydrolase [Chloroflexota bacterium]